MRTGKKGGERVEGPWAVWLGAEVVQGVLRRSSDFTVQEKAAAQSVALDSKASLYDASTIESLQEPFRLGRSNYGKYRHIQGLSEELEASQCKQVRLGPKIRKDGEVRAL
jgi:hypothetical protein